MLRDPWDPITQANYLTRCDIEQKIRMKNHAPFVPSKHSTIFKQKKREHAEAKEPAQYPNFHSADRRIFSAPRALQDRNNISKEEDTLVSSRRKLEICTHASCKMPAKCDPWSTPSLTHPPAYGEKSGWRAACKWPRAALSRDVHSFTWERTRLVAARDCQCHGDARHRLLLNACAPQHTRVVGRLLLVSAVWREERGPWTYCIRMRRHVLRGRCCGRDTTAPGPSFCLLRVSIRLGRTRPVQAQAFVCGRNRRSGRDDFSATTESRMVVNGIARFEEQRR